MPIHPSFTNVAWDRPPGLSCCKHKDKPGGLSHILENDSSRQLHRTRFVGLRRDQTEGRVGGRQLRERERRVVEQVEGLEAKLELGFPLSLKSTFFNIDALISLVPSPRRLEKAVEKSYALYRECAGQVALKGEIKPDRRRTPDTTDRTWHQQSGAISPKRRSWRSLP